MKAKKYIISIVIGITVGILTVIGQKYLSIHLNFLANSASMWLIPAFLIPYMLKTNKKDSIIVSIITLIFCVLGYYIFEAIFNHHAFEFSRIVKFWLMCAILGGLVFGLGANYSNTQENVIKSISMNLLPAVFISEPLYKFIHISEYGNIVIDILLQMILGLTLYYGINKKESLKAKNLFVCMVLVLLGVLGFHVLSIIL